MRIKKLELVGFKSFKDRTVIHFDAGITGVVGPNGCGKSNIVDALIWVMGEMSAKHLRGSSMEDVIFAGAEGYAPVGMAEVSLTLENDGGPFPVQYMKHSEIMVTRRLHRSGESEYFLNREPARLRDIQEIFMDTGAGSKGFSIIEQGAIGKIITAKPEDRRSLIEEAAGITKFKVRKRESQRKLVATDQNLIRLNDIVTELKRQLDSLQRQAQRAERYRNLKREIEDLDLWLSSRQWFELKETSDEARRLFEESEATEVGAQSRVTQLDAEVTELRALLTEREATANDKQNAHYELKMEIQKRESEVTELRFEIEQARRNKEMTGSLLQENETRREILEADLNKVQESLARIQEDAAQLTLEYETKKELFENSSSRIEEVDLELTQARREQLTVGQGESSCESRLNSTAENIISLQERVAEQQAIMEELTTKRDEFESRRKKVWNSLEKERQMQLDILRDVETLEAENKTLTQQLQDKRTEVETFKDNLNETTSRLYGLENLANSFEGFQEGVKSVMFWQRQRLEKMPEGQRAEAAQFQPVAEVVEVPAEYELAMEAALGPRLQMLLSDTSDSAMSAVDYLKEQNSGRSSFYASDLGAGLQMQAASDVTKEAPVKAILKDVVKAPDRFKPTVTRLLEGVAVVESIHSALDLRAKYPAWTFVTSEGDVLTADGILTGGTAESADSGMLKRRREIKELSEKKDEWSGKLALAQASLKKLEEQVKAIALELEGTRKKNTEKEITLAELKKDLERAEQELANVQNAITRQDRDLSSVQNQLQHKMVEQEDLQTKLMDLKERKAELDSRIDTLSEEMQLARAGIDDLQEEVTTLKVQSATKNQERDGLERQKDMLSRSLNDVQTQLTRMSEESTRSTETMSSNQIVLEEKKVALEQMIGRVEELAGEVSAARNSYEELQTKVRELERELNASQSQKNTLQQTMNEAKLHLEQARMKEVYLIDQIRERYILDLPEVAPRYKDREGDVKESEARLKDLREKIGRIGDVNLSAIEEYDEVVGRYDFLSKQQQDLVEAKEQLRKVIERINRICSRRFKETFDQVNERFTKVFPVLFGGGEAHLILIEDPEKGDAGIDIVAKPPGKKMTSVTLMSGGEKALTAVSLIFSIFLVKPSPYCLLDEVDAPLDDANVSRFNDLVREMAKRSQIIVVTHNKHTMEVASKLYGVTMQEKGVSKMVSVNLGQAVEVAGA